MKNTQQITRAMKFVAAAKLRRAQDRVLAARPFARRMQVVLNSMAARAQTRHAGKILHPLLAQRAMERICLILITGDKGLCGAFNTNLVAATKSFLLEHSERGLSLILVGKKGWDALRKSHYRIRGDYVNRLAKASYELAQEIAGPVIEAYSKGEVDAVYVIYNECKSVLQQRRQTELLLPIRQATTTTAPSDPVLIDYIYEQTPERILADLLPKYVETQILRALLESAAAFYAASMTAMDAATNNAADMISSLTLTMNKIRQASITKEIIEIVSGATALEGSGK